VLPLWFGPPLAVIAVFVVGLFLLTAPYVPWFRLSPVQVPPGEALPTHFKVVGAEPSNHCLQACVRLAVATNNHRFASAPLWKAVHPQGLLQQGDELEQRHCCALCLMLNSRWGNLAG